MMNRWLATLTLPLALAAACDARVIDEDAALANARTGACEEWGTMNVCGPGAEQYCAESEEDRELRWAECVPEEVVECVPGTCVGDDHCGLLDGVPTLDEDGCIVQQPEEPSGDDVTPLVLVLEGARVEMTASAASFDVVGSGPCLQTDWPAATTPWIALDWNRDGQIEGPELFGSGTLLRSGFRAPDGFTALAELDSNGDGSITAADDRFDELLLWADHDGDRRSTHWELTALSTEVDSISLSYRSEPTCDDRGNCAIERASAVTPTSAAAEIVDLHLACQ